MHIIFKILYTAMFLIASTAVSKNSVVTTAEIEGALATSHRGIVTGERAARLALDLGLMFSPPWSRGLGLGG